MKIAFDLDGVVMAKPEIYCAMAHGLVEAGHTVGVLSSRNENDLNKILYSLELAGFPEPSFLLLKNGTEKEIFKNTLWNNGLWKAIECERGRIDLLIDDFDENNENYIKAFNLLQPGKLVLVCV